MAVSTYVDVRQAVWDLLDLTATYYTTAKIDVLLAGCEDKILRDPGLRVRQMETALSNTIVSGVVALPADYLELKNAYLDGSPTTPLQRKSAEWMFQNYPTRSSDAKPKFIARDAGNFIFGPYPDSGYLLKGTYYARSVVAGTSAALVGLLATFPNLLIFSGAAEVEKAMGRSERSPIWLASYKELRDSVMIEAREEAWSGSPLAVTAG